MSTNGLDQRICKIMTNVFGISAEQFTSTLSPADVGNWDSLGHVQLVQALQTEFALEFDVEEYMALENVEKIREILAKHGVAK